MSHRRTLCRRAHCRYESALGAWGDVSTLDEDMVWIKGSRGCTPLQAVYGPRSLRSDAFRAGWPGRPNSGCLSRRRSPCSASSRGYRHRTSDGSIDTQGVSGSTPRCLRDYIALRPAPISLASIHGFRNDLTGHPRASSQRSEEHDA